MRDLRDAKARVSSSDYSMTPARLSAVFSPALQPLIQEACKVFAQPSGVDFAQVATALALTCAGAVDDRVRFVFDLFDLNGDGILERDGVRGLVACAVHCVVTAHGAVLNCDLDAAVAAAFQQCDDDDSDDFWADVEEADDDDDFERSDSRDDASFDHVHKISRSDFVTFCVNHRLARAFLDVVGLAPRTRRLQEAEDARLKALEFDRAVAAVRPPWTIGFFGEKGTREALLRAQGLPKIVATWLLDIQPFVAPLDDARRYGIILRARRRLTLLVHIEELDQGSSEELREERRMKAAHSARVVTRRCGAGDLCTVALPPLTPGRRHVVSMAVDPCSNVDWSHDLVARGASSTEPTSLWSADFTPPFVARDSHRYVRT